MDLLLFLAITGAASLVVAGIIQLVVVAFKRARMRYDSGLRYFVRKDRL